jgi:hypothetical protein
MGCLRRTRASSGFLVPVFVLLVASLSPQPFLRRNCVPFFSGTATLPFVRRFGLKEVEAATNGFTAVVAGGGVQGPLRRRPRGDGPAGERRGGWTSTGRCSCWGGSTTATSSGCTGSLKATTTTTGSFRFSLCLCPAMLMFAMIHPVAAFGVLVS